MVLSYCIVRRNTLEAPVEAGKEALAWVSETCGDTWNLGHCWPSIWKLECLSYSWGWRLQSIAKHCRTLANEKSEYNRLSTPEEDAARCAPEMGVLRVKETRKQSKLIVNIANCVLKHYIYIYLCVCVSCVYMYIIYIYIHTLYIYITYIYNILYIYNLYIYYI